MAASEDYLKQQVRRDVGDIGSSAQHEIVFPVETTGGTWTYTLAGAETAAIAYPNAAATVQSEIESLATIGAGNVIVTLGQRGFILTFQGDLANQAIPMPTVDGNNLVLSEGTAPSVPVREVKAGKANHWTDARIDDMWDRHSDKATFELQQRYVRLDAIRELKGIVWTQIDEQTGDQRRDFEKQFGHLVQMEKATIAEIEDLLTGIDSTALLNAGQSYGGVPAVRISTQARFDARFPRAVGCA